MEYNFKIGDEVYLATDPEQLKRIVIGILIRQTGVLYELGCGEDTSYHYDFEISENKEL